MSDIATAADKSDSVASRLAEYFDPSEVKFLPKVVKQNRALAMAYVDARVIQDRLDAAVGPENWEDEYTHLPDGCVSCKLKIRFGDRWVSKQDVGSPSAQPDAGDRMKAAYSDALKRAAVKFGVGRYLYSIPSFWADYDPVKKAWTTRPQLPAAFRPQGVTTTVHQPPPQQPLPPPPQQPLPPRQQQQPNAALHQNGRQPNQLPAAGKPQLATAAEYQSMLNGINGAKSWPELEAAMWVVANAKRAGKLTEGALATLKTAAETMCRKFPPQASQQTRQNTKPAASGDDVKALIDCGEAAFGGEGFDGWLMQHHQLTRNALHMLAADEIRRLADAIGEEVSQQGYPDNHEEGPQDGTYY